MFFNTGLLLSANQVFGLLTQCTWSLTVLRLVQWFGVKRKATVLRQFGGKRGSTLQGGEEGVIQAGRQTLLVRAVATGLGKHQKHTIQNKQRNLLNKIFNIL